jgi:hypothetical protein
MTSRTNKIDIEWANSLVGLPVKIPDNWWVGYTGTYLHDGKLVAFDVVNQNWCVELDDQDDDDHYLIAYDAVCEYTPTNSIQPSIDTSFLLNWYLMVMMKLKLRMELYIR